MKKEFKDNQEFFNDVIALQKELESSGENIAANEIKEGMGLINGLTDGWAIFLDSLNKVKSMHSSSLTAEQEEKLSYYIEITSKAVSRD